MTNNLDLSEEKNWLSLKKDLKNSVGDSAYNNWLKHLSFISFENTTLSFSLPTKFLRDWIVNNYSDKIKSDSKKYINNIEVIDNRYKPSDLYNTCRRFAEKWGTFVKDEEGNDKQYIPNDKQQITLVVTDHISLLDPEYNEVSKTFMSKQQSMAKWHTHYCRRILAKEWKWSVLNVQQQALDSAKEQYNYKGTSIINKVLPSLEGLANNKEIGRDDYVSLGLFSPDMFNLPEFRGYGIDEGKSTDMGDRFRSLHLLKNRFGTPNKILPLYFDGRYTYFKELPLATSPNMNYFYNLLKK